MNQVIAKFGAFKTEENLRDAWVKKVWIDTGFTTYVPFSTEYDLYLEEVNIVDLINEFYEALITWFRLADVSIREFIENESLADGSSTAENDMNWQALINEGIDYKPLVCIIGSLILRFLDEPSNSIFFREALCAIRLYSYIISIPGSHICQIFNSTLYSHILSVIKICCEQIDSSSSSKGVKRKKDEYVDDIVDEDSAHHLNCDKTEVITILSDFLSHLRCILGNKKFKLDRTSINLTIQILMEITRLEKVYTTLLVNNLSNYRKNSVSHVAHKGFMILLSLSNSLHNNPMESAKLMMKSLLPIFLITELRTMGLNIKDASIVRTNYVCFLKLLLDNLGDIAYEAVNILVQRICVAVPDRAEMRQKASNIVLDILRVSPPDLQAGEIYSIVQMSHMSEIKIRLFTLEIISKLLLEADNVLFSKLPQKFAAVTSDEFLLAVILYRCQDVATSVRTKALSYFDQIITSSNSNRKSKKLVEKIFIEPYQEAENAEFATVYQKEIFDTQQFLLEEKFLDDCSLNPLPGVKVILDMLMYFSQEDKVFIKKCTLQLLSRIILFNRMWIRKDLLQVFLIACDDSSVLIRKTISQNLTDLMLMYPDHENLITCWVEGVVPMIAEEEIKAQEKVIEHFNKVILSNMMYHPHTTTVISRLPWAIMKEILKQDKRSFLHFAVGKWVQGNAVKSKTVQIIYSHLDKEYNDVAWCLLVSFSQFMSLPMSNIVYEYFEHIVSDLNVVEHSQLVLETLYYVCSGMQKESKMKLLKQLETNLMLCTLPLKLIARCRDICEQIVGDLAGKKIGHSAVIEWSEPKISAFLKYIHMQIGKNASVEIQNPEILIKHIFMLGEFAQAAPTCISKEDIKLLEYLLLSPRKRENEAWKGKASNAVKAITILTLVKLVLQKEETANTVMPIFKEILSSTAVDATIQVNTIIGMCDLCSRYTTLVERYFTSICKCFNSSHEIVRKTALTCVMKRIREEYIKLRPFVLFPMLTMILDKSFDIKRSIATFIMIDLKKKNNVLETFYTGLFFFLNNCKEHSTTVKIPDDVRTMFSLTDKPEDREYIYIYILDKLADTNRRLIICKKIIHDVMGSVADETLKIDEKTENIVDDAFKILTDNEKKISEAISKSKKSNTDEAEEFEEYEGGSQPKKSSQSHGAATITEGLRLNEANEIIPIIMKLRLLLKKRKSKCLKSLMFFMCELMRTFKNEVNEMKELLGGDGELTSEIVYNIRRIEQQEEEQRKRNETAEMAENTDQRNEDENRNIPVLPGSPREICEQLQNLIVQLSRCDETMLKNNNVDKEQQNENEEKYLQPTVRISKCDIRCENTPTAGLETNSASKSKSRQRGSSEDQGEQSISPNVEVCAERISEINIENVELPQVLLSSPSKRNSKKHVEDGNNENEKGVTSQRSRSLKDTKSPRKQFEKAAVEEEKEVRSQRNRSKEKKSPNKRVECTSEIAEASSQRCRSKNKKPTKRIDEVIFEHKVKEEGMSPQSKSSKPKKSPKKRVKDLQIETEVATSSLKSKSSKYKNKKNLGHNDDDEELTEERVTELIVLEREEAMLVDENNVNFQCTEDEDTLIVNAAVYGEEGPEIIGEDQFSDDD